ncbi:MAG: HTH-type transcriptional regulator CymR [Phycisphaerae bacterium]|nr:HTH-type transcriptional regulator CymR [Phycisphaerae bacterium]
MTISLKCQYAIRAVLELAKRSGRRAVPISEIARAYSISARFLEVILNQLKKGGFVGSRRGVQGGFFLAIDPREINVGQIVRFIDGPLDMVRCETGRRGRECPRSHRCALVGTWRRARDAVSNVLDSANFADLAAQDSAEFVADFCI